MTATQSNGETLGEILHGAAGGVNLRSLKRKRHFTVSGKAKGFDLDLSHPNPGRFVLLQPAPLDSAPPDVIIIDKVQAEWLHNMLSKMLFSNVFDDKE